MKLNFIAAFFVATAVTIFTIYLLYPLATRLKLVDSPGGRKKHNGEIPLIGGVAMFIGFTFGCLTLGISLQNFRSFFAASAILVFLGILDDMHELAPRLRLIGQFFAAFIVTVFGGAVLSNLGNILFVGPVLLAPGLNDFISILAIMTLINAMNMLDGADGVVGSLSLLQLGFFLFLVITHHQIYQAKLLLLLVAVILSFLLFNFPAIPLQNRKKIFMGDAGSTFLGLVAAWFCIVLSQGKTQVAAPVTFLWIMALPLFDLLNVIIRRAMKKQSPFHADREHLHHLLQAAKFTPTASVFIVILMSALLGSIGVLFEYLQVSEWVSFCLFVALFLVYFYLVKHAWKTKKLLFLCRNYFVKSRGLGE